MATSNAPGGDYNVVPYVSKPFAQSQPARLAALATLFGLSPPNVARARALELGCASGGNIIPLALRFPDADFQGIDLGERHVADGRARVAALGVANVAIRQGDIGALDLGEARFDYIICHGVYSWVPASVREAIFSLVARHLKPDGIAYISYNVLPGWHQRRIIRDLMLMHAGRAGAPADRVTKARAILDTVAAGTRQETAFGNLLSSEARQLAGMADSYILGEFLADDNAPCYFSEFAAAADAHALAYLCEAEIDQCLPENLGAETAAQIRQLSADQLVPLEQYMDYFKGRTFRQSLLVHRAASKRIVRRIVPDRFRSLHFAGRGTTADHTVGGFVFTTPAGGTLTSHHPGVRHAFEELNTVFPATLSLAELAAAARRSAGRDWSDLNSQLLDAVFKAVLSGLIEISSVARRATNTVPDRPRVAHLAERDTKDGLDWTTGVAHNEVALDVVTTALVPHLDGTNGSADLVRHLLAAIGEGRVRLLDNTTGVALAGDALEKEAAEHVRQALTRLASAGLLI